MYNQGDKVTYVPLNVRGVVTDTNVEGWFEIQFCDQSHSVVRPSQLIAGWPAGKRPIPEHWKHLG